VCCLGLAKGPSIEGALFSWESSNKKSGKQDDEEEEDKKQTISSKEEEFFSKFDVSPNLRSLTASSNKDKNASSSLAAQSRNVEDDFVEPPSEPATAVTPVKQVQTAVMLETETDVKSSSILGKKKSE